MLPPISRALAPLAAALLVAACGQEKAPLPGTRGADNPAIDPHGAAEMPSAASTGMVSSPHAASAAVEEGQSLALKLEGIGGKGELDHALAKLTDEEARALFEMGFRQCFVADAGRRDYPGAAAAMTSVLQRQPDFAPAYRVLAYAALNTGFDMQGATQHYEKAVELDPDYGEAHYALSFMLTQFDVERGRKHFKKAMELGIPDERNLGPRFYPE
jgi:tetratricopeptide (TPR) repeat protein